MKHDEAAGADGEGHMAVDIDVGVAAVPIARDGGPVPGFGQLGVPDPPPPLDPATFICMRDCRYYFETKTHFEHGNTGVYKPGTGPVQFVRACMRIPGVYLEISGDAPVLECNMWDPLSMNDITELGIRRERHFAANPDHEPPVIEEDTDLGENDEISDVVRDKPDPEETD